LLISAEEPPQPARLASALSLTYAQVVKLKKAKATANSLAAKTAEAANVAGRTYFVLRFTEKLSDAKNSGAEVGGLGPMIEEVESWGWTLDKMIQENDQRTFGDRAVFYLGFRKDEDDVSAVANEQEAGGVGTPPPPPA
jgi:hypothetical protein